MSMRGLEKDLDGSAMEWDVSINGRIRDVHSRAILQNDSFILLSSVQGARAVPWAKYNPIPSLPFFLASPISLGSLRPVMP